MSIRRTGTLLTAYVLLSSVWVPGASSAYADDDLRLDQWGLDAVQASEGWETTTGAGVTVALLDTGVDDTHSDLGFSPDSADSEDSTSVVSGPDLTGEDLEPGAESFGIRGTKLAGIVAASGHGQDYSGGVMGVAPDAMILSVRVTGEPDGDASADPGVVAEGLRHAVQEGAQVALLPAGVDGDNTDLAEAVEFADHRGVLVVAPVGVTVPGALTVSAVDEDLAPVSAEWDAAHIAAPGSEIVTTSAGGDYSQAEGPEAAAAFVAGAGALIRAAHPHLRTEDVAEALTHSAQPIESAPVTEPGAQEPIPEQAPQEQVPEEAPLQEPVPEAPADGGESLDGPVEEAPPVDAPLNTAAAAISPAANGLEETPDEGGETDDEGEEDAAPTGLLDTAAALNAAEEIASESEPFDEDLVSTEEDDVSILWIVGAVLGVAVAGTVILVIVLRRRWSNPYDLPERETIHAPEPESPRRGGRRRRR